MVTVNRNQRLDTVDTIYEHINSDFDVCYGSTKTLYSHTVYVTNPGIAPSWATKVIYIYHTAEKRTGNQQEVESMFVLHACIKQQSILCHPPQRYSVHHPLMILLWDVRTSLSFNSVWYWYGTCHVCNARCSTENLFAEPISLPMLKATMPTVLTAI